MAVRGGPLTDSALTARRLSENGRTIVASPDYLARWGVPETPEDLYNHNCLNFSFRRAEPVWPFRRDGIDFALKVRGAIEANSGETLGQLALDGVGIARVGNFSLGDAIAEGRLVPLLELFNPGDKEVFHAVFVGGANMPARVRVFVDYLVECMGGSRGRGTALVEGKSGWHCEAWNGIGFDLTRRRRIDDFLLSRTYDVWCYRDPPTTCENGVAANYHCRSSRSSDADQTRAAMVASAFSDGKARSHPRTLTISGQSAVPSGATSQ